MVAALAAAAWGQENEAASYAYTSGDRRDPFADPRRIGRTGPQLRCRCSGPGGFLIQEIALRGVVRTPTGYTAMFEGPDRKSYFTKAGDRLYDGTITAVDTAGLTVRQEVTDPLAAAKTREVRLVLHAADNR
jgi:Tfp pilus assembly protein PilP